MWLINCKKQPICLEEFIGSDIPSFAILSHTWDPVELTYQQFGNLDARISSPGWQKVEGACKLALSDGHEHIWIDSCCIDKSSSAELTEAINSMFEWYRTAAICYAYLSDYDSASPDARPLRAAKWWTRGWTLQELIAPVEVSFFDKNWVLFGTRSFVAPELSLITGIEANILCRPEGTAVHDLLEDMPVCKRMSWAANRRTTRVEDVAYSLLGLFGVNMPLLYGEGTRAFQRLQEEIMRNVNDLSLFAWTSQPRDRTDVDNAEQKFRGAFASSPAEFSSAGDIALSSPAKFHPEFSMSNKGVRILASLHETHTDLVVMQLLCHREPNKADKLSIYLKLLGGGVYARAEPQKLNLIRRPENWVTNNDIFIAKTLSGATVLTIGSSHRGAFMFSSFSARGRSGRGSVRQLETIPNNLWDPIHGMFITAGVTDFVGYLVFEYYRAHQPSANEKFVVMCGIEPSSQPWVTVRPFDSLQGHITSSSLDIAARLSLHQKFPGRVITTLPSGLALRVDTRSENRWGEPIRFVDMTIVESS